MLADVLQPDLFGGESRIIEPSASPYKDFKIYRNYRKATGKENCSNCEYSLINNKWRKCNLMGASNSQNTDVSRNKVCNAHRWKKD
jgi:hypothetical protein